MSVAVVSPPSGPLNATVNVPGSKSVANRALICAMLANGESIISRVPTGDDTQVIVDTLQHMGKLHQLNEHTLVIRGGAQVELPGIIDAQLAGTSSRFLTAVAALGHNTVVVDGGPTLRSRPMGDLHKALIQLGADLTPLGEEGHLPVSVTGGSLKGGHVTIRGDVSSQFISSLMLIAPLLADGLQIQIEGTLVSRSYVVMTQKVMQTFGASVEVSESQILVQPGSYQACTYEVEPDYSSAAFPLAALALRGGVVRIPSLESSHMQGDGAIVKILTSMGVTCEFHNGDLIASHDDTNGLSALKCDMSDCSDLVPAVAVMCSVANGDSEISGVAFIRNKESDRIGDLSSELAKAGFQVTVTTDGLQFRGVSAAQSASFETHHDHRLAMALSLTSLVSGQCEIQNFEVIAKSWPSYFEDMKDILGPVTKAK